MKSTLPFLKTEGASWSQAGNQRPKQFKCGFCSQKVASEKGYFPQVGTGHATAEKALIYVCPNCKGPTLFTIENEQIPFPAIGDSVPNVPTDLTALYEEARQCTTTSCFTAAVLLCRKLLMHIAVEKGAKAGDSFMSYVDFLAGKGYVPPDGKDWVDHIRKKSNDANHQIILMDEAAATDLLTFTEMLLRFIYEFPARVKPASGTATPKK